MFKFVYMVFRTKPIRTAGTPFRRVPKSRVCTRVSHGHGKRQGSLAQSTNLLVACAFGIALRKIRTRTHTHMDTDYKLTSHRQDYHVCRGSESRKAGLRRWR